MIMEVILRRHCKIRQNLILVLSCQRDFAQQMRMRILRRMKIWITRHSGIAALSEMVNWLWRKQRGRYSLMWSQCSKKLDHIIQNRQDCLSINNNPIKPFLKSVLLMTHWKIWLTSSRRILNCLYSKIWISARYCCCASWSAYSSTQDYWKCHLEQNKSRNKQQHGNNKLNTCTGDMQIKPNLDLWSNKINYW